MRTLFVATVLSTTAALAAPNPTDLVEKAEYHLRGESFQGKMRMEIERDGQNRSLELRTWSVGTELSLIKVLKPVKDKDTGNLRQDLQLWQYLPKIDRTVKIPPSMMLQSWMGSDFTNDDLVKSSSLSRDYTHKIEKTETIGGEKALKIECLPKPTAPVVWGKVNLWVRESDSVPLKREFYTEKNELLKVLEGSEYKTFGTHTIPTKLVMTNVKQNTKTTLIYSDAEFDKKLEKSIFTEQNLRKPAKD